MLYQFTIAEILEIENLENQGLYSDAYALVAQILSDNAPDTDEVNQVRIWFEGASQVNSNSGLFDILIRSYTQRQGELHFGVSSNTLFSDSQIQEASDEVARRALDSIINPLNDRQLPDINSIAIDDATGVGDTLFVSDLNDTAFTNNAAWSGVTLFSLLGSDQTFRLLNSGNSNELDTLDDLRNILFAIDSFDYAIGQVLTSPFATTLADLFTSLSVLSLDPGKTASVAISPTAEDALIDLTKGDVANSGIEYVVRTDRLDTVSKLRELFGLQNVTITEENYSTHAFELFSLIEQQFPNGFQILNLSQVDSSTLFDNASQDTDLGLAHRYTLENLLPFVITGDNSIYSTHNSNQELDIENISSTYLQDRADLLSNKIALNEANVAYEEVGSSFDEFGIDNYYEDKVTGLILNPILSSTTPDIIFGSDTDETDLIGRGGDDRIYGQGGNDHLSGNDGDDYFEGGKGSDVIEGGEGADTLYGNSLAGDVPVDDNTKDILQGGAGNDTYHVGAGDEINDSDGSGTIEYRDANGAQVFISGRTFKILQDDVYESTDADKIRVHLNATNNTLTVLDGIPFTILNFQSGHFNITLDNVPESISYTLIQGTDEADSPSGDGEPTDVTATENNDEIHLLEGDDEANGLGGQDLIFGGIGADRISGGDDNDMLQGEGGRDIVFGDDGDDQLSGGTENDIILGGNDNDVLFGDGGIDVLLGGEGSDVLLGGDNDDFLMANGNASVNNNWDFIWTNISNFNFTHFGFTFDAGQLNTGPNNEGTPTPTGNSPNSLFGGNGNDYLVGGNGNDYFDTGIGNSLVQAGDGDDIVIGNNDVDVIVGDGGNDQIYAGSGNDIVYGDDFVGTASDFTPGAAGNDYIDGGAGDDTIFGGAENDTILGGLDNDTLNGDEGNDHLDGGDGNDTLNGGDDDDVLNGGADNDILDGGSGTNILNGGEGNDTYIYSSLGGNNIVNDSDGGNTIKFADSSLSVNTPNVSLDGNDLLISGGSGSSIRVTDWVANQSIDSIEYSDGVILPVSYGFTSNMTGQVFNVDINANSSTTTGTELNDILINLSLNSGLDGAEGDDIYVLNTVQTNIFDSSGDDTIIIGSGINSLGFDSTEVQGFSDTVFRS